MRAGGKKGEIFLQAKFSGYIYGVYYISCIVCYNIMLLLYQQVPIYSRRTAMVTPTTPLRYGWLSSQLC